MLTLQEIDAKILDTTTVMQVAGADSADYKREQRNLEFYRTMRLYILTNPLEDYVRDQVKILEGRLQRIDENYANWITQQKFENERQRFDYYNSQMGVHDIKRKLKALKFLL